MTNEPAQLDAVPPADIVRLCAMLNVPAREGCWIWAGHRNRKGYGQFWMQGRAHWAHRVSYAAFNGPIEAGQHIDHKCRNTSCCNPDHLQAIDPATNRALQHSRTTDDIPF